MTFLVALLVQSAKYHPMKLRFHQVVQDVVMVQNGLIQHLGEQVILLPDYPYS